MAVTVLGVTTSAPRIAGGALRVAGSSLIRDSYEYDEMLTELGDWALFMEVNSILVGMS